jgi:serine-type D-Ala-D-Ala carboxypeptidase (penicillin-binding protein 5/6)
LLRPAAALAALLCLGPAGPRAAEGDPPDAYPRAGRAYVVAIDGVEVWARAPDLPLPPASLTKLMTALLALEAGQRPGAWVEVSPRAARETGSRAGLRAGEALTVEGALTATLVSSSNDACLALAEHLAGSAPAFVARMNARAAALGLGATHFRNPCGHDAPGHVSSARDLLRLTRAALSHPELRRLVALTGATVTTRGGRSIPLRTHNLLLGRLEGARGVKSGYTEGAGRCMVALAERDGVEVLAVLLDSPDRWWTTAALVELAFDEVHKRG